MKARGAPPAPKLSAAVSHLVEAPTWTVETLARVLPLGAAAAVVAAGLNGNGPVVAPVPSDAGALLSNATALIGTPAETTEARFERWLALFRSTARPDAHAADLAAAILDMAHSVFLHVAETATASKPSSSVATGNEGHHHAPVALRFQAASTFQAERRARLIEALRRALDESLLSPAQFLAAQLPFLLDLPTNCLAAVLLQRSIVTRPSSISLDPTATLVVPWFLLFGAPMLRHVREDVKALSATILDSYAAALLRCSNMTPSPYPPPPGSRVHVPARSGALVKAVDLVECGPTEAWDLLYSSGHDGFAMTSFAECVLDYPGPTLLLVRDETGAVFGMHVAERWQDTTVSWGTDGCRLIQLVPKLAVHRPTGRQRLYAYFNSTSTRFRLCVCLVLSNSLASVGRCSVGSAPAAPPRCPTFTLIRRSKTARLAAPVPPILRSDMTNEGLLKFASSRSGA